MTTHTIEIRDGSAYLCGCMLLVRYPAGDCDLAPAQPTTEREREMLEGALYDSLQCDGLLRDGDEVNTPDGALFGFCDGFDFIRATTTTTPRT